MAASGRTLTLARHDAPQREHNGDGGSSHQSEDRERQHHCHVPATLIDDAGRVQRPEPDSMRRDRPDHQKANDDVKNQKTDNDKAPGVRKLSPPQSCRDQCRRDWNGQGYAKQNRRKNVHFNCRSRPLLRSLSSPTKGPPM